MVYAVFMLNITLHTSPNFLVSTFSCAFLLQFNAYPLQFEAFGSYFTQVLEFFTKNQIVASIKPTTLFQNFKQELSVNPFFQMYVFTTTK